MTIDWTDFHPQAIASLRKGYAPHQLANVEDTYRLMSAMEHVLHVLSHEADFDSADVYTDCEACLPELLEQSSQRAFEVDLARWRQEGTGPTEDMKNHNEVVQGYREHLLQEVGENKVARMCLGITQLCALTAASERVGDREAISAVEGFEYNSYIWRIKGDVPPKRRARVWLSPLGDAGERGLKQVLERRNILAVLFPHIIDQCKKVFVPLETATEGDFVGIQFLYEMNFNEGSEDVVGESVRGLNAVYAKADGLRFEPYRRGLTEELDRLEDMICDGTSDESRETATSVFYQVGAMRIFEGLGSGEATATLSCFRDFSIIEQDPVEWFNAPAPKGTPLCLLLDRWQLETEGFKDAAMKAIICLNEHSDGHLGAAVEEFAA